LWRGDIYQEGVFRKNKVGKSGEQEGKNKMRVSEYYHLGRTQPELDFVDVDIYGDVRIYVDPRALRLLPSQWGDECVSLIQNFFKTVLEAIKTGKDEQAKILLRTLREPNETHLGLSREKARGRALGYESAVDVYKALSQSEAARSGLLEDLEDTILMVDGIDRDIISDITTNIIRGPLISYTNRVCSLYGIPLVSEVASGPLWNPENKEWISGLVPLPVAGSKLLLVPKAIVRKNMDYDADEYYDDYVLEYLMEEELSSPKSELVRLLKDGRRKVTKKDLKGKYGRGKKVILRETLRNPDLLERYRSDKRTVPKPPLNHLEIAEVEGTNPPNWDSLFGEMVQVVPGNEESSKYEKAIEGLLTALFYPALTNPQVQFEIHEGRKRIDITYTNIAERGFFRWLSQHYPAPHVFVECKNYGREIGNPELDQISGRFSPSRGKFGILVCRNFKDKELFWERCRDTANDSRGFVIPLDDGDLEDLVDYKKDHEDSIEFPLLKQFFNRLII